MRRRAVTRAVSATRQGQLVCHVTPETQTERIHSNTSIAGDAADPPMPVRAAAKKFLAVWLIASFVFLIGCERKDSVQSGYRGTAMAQLYSPARLAAQADINRIPPPEPSDPYDPAMPMATEVNQNVQVLTDLNALEFARLMQALSTWVSPEQGCEYCHNIENLASDEKYTKIVSREMLQMTRDINTNWKSHVADTGVTCWTCHRGQPVPSDIWFKTPEPRTPSAGVTGNKAGQNTAGVAINGNTSLPFDPLTPFLGDDFDVAVQGTTALPTGNRSSIKQTEWTYSLMMYMSNSLGVNCTYCHHTRAMGRWDQSTPQRVTAWHGIRMVRAMNADYLEPLKPLYPAHRLGPTGDAPKAACATCHKGAFKPMYGVSMLGDYPSLAGVLPGRLKPEAEAGPAADAAVEDEDSLILADAQTASSEAVPEADNGDAPAVGSAEAAGNGGVEAGDAEEQTLAGIDAAALQGETSETDSSSAETTVSADEDVAAEETSQVAAGESVEADAAQPVGSEQAGDASEQIAQTEDGQPAIDGQESVEQTPNDADSMIAETSPLTDTAAGENASSMPSSEPEEQQLALADLEDRIGRLQDKLRSAAAERDALRSQSSAPELGTDSPQPLFEVPMTESERLAAELEQIRSRVGLQSDRLYGEGNIVFALRAAEERVAATEAWLRHERSALEQRLALAMSEREALEKEAEYRLAQMSESHTAALAAAEERLAAAEATLQHERDARAQRMESVLAEQAAAGAEARVAATEARVAQDQADARADVERTAEPGEGSSREAAAADKTRMDALEDAERRLTAARARLDQERTALQQQLEVVREQRDSARAEIESELGKQHAAALNDAERRLNAVQARLEQQSTALQQQLEVVRGQRDDIEAAVEARLEKQHASRMGELRRHLAAVQARLDQQSTALEQQLEVVRAQRDQVADEVAASLGKDHQAELQTLESRLAATGAKLEQQSHALQQQLEVVRAQRDAAKAETDARLEELAQEHAKALEEMQKDIAAREARLDQERTALKQQLDVVRSQRDSAGEAARSDAEQTAELTALRGKLADADAAIADLREQLSAAEAARDEQRDLAEARAEADASRLQMLSETAAEVGGTLTDAGILVSLGGDELQFASGSAVLPEGELPTLARTADLLASRPGLLARIEGHTDSLGSAEINQRLSKQRAEAVMLALIARGIDAGRLRAEGVGPERPVADNATARGRSENRRVEIYLVEAEE
jgi:photosynthetic reaction center cytochrome c subunit